MKTSLGTCPQRLLVSLPLFSTDMITYVQWDPNSDDLTPLDLHQESLTIPPIKINRTVIDNFDELFQRYDGQLSDTLQKADSLIDQIEETTISSYVEYIAFTALGLSVINFIVCCIVYRRIFRIFGRRAAHTLPPPLPAPVSNNLQRKVCGHCSKPEKNDRPKKAARKQCRDPQRFGAKEQ